MKSWGLGIISIGCIMIMTAPVLFDDYYLFLIEGIVVSILGFIVFRKSKK